MITPHFGTLNTGGTYLVKAERKSRKLGFGQPEVIKDYFFEGILVENSSSYGLQFRVSRNIVPAVPPLPESRYLGFHPTQIKSLIEVIES